MANITTIKAGVTVEKFLEQLNDNFQQLNDDNTTKQSQIYIIKTGQSTTDIKGESIAVRNDGTPTGGSDGDIVIVYE